MDDRRESGVPAKAPQREESQSFTPFRLCVSAVGSAVLVVCFALVVRFSMLSLTARALQKDPDGYMRLAVNLVEYGTLGNKQTPTAYRPPLYPLVLTPCVSFSANNAATLMIAIMALHLLLGVATVGLVFLLGRWWGLGRIAAAIAALLIACDPILLACSSLVMTETLATFLATAGLVALTWVERQRLGWQWNGHPNTEALVESQRPRWLPKASAPSGSPPRSVDSRLLTIAGVVLGLASLCRPAFLLWTLAAGVVLWWQAFRERPRVGGNGRGLTVLRRIAGSLLVPAAFALGAIIVLSPWAIRNQLQFGRPILTTTHGGYTFYLANNRIFYNWLGYGRWGSVWSADPFNDKWDSQRTGSELHDDRYAYSLAWQAIRAKPGTFLYACLVRIGRFWSPLPHRLMADESPLRRLSRYVVGLWYTVVFLLAIVGAWRLHRSSRRSFAEEAAIFESPKRFRPWRWGLLLIACLMVAHVVYWTDMRMRAPIMPVVALFAAAGLAGCRPHDE
jgi:4-amino-4-deoxy-L-arabinose transferase-like glycosyltransferase